MAHFSFGLLISQKNAERNTDLSVKSLFTLKGEQCLRDCFMKGSWLFVYLFESKVAVFFQNKISKKFFIVNRKSPSSL